MRKTFSGMQLKLGLNSVNLSRSPYTYCIRMKERRAFVAMIDICVQSSLVIRRSFGGLLDGSMLAVIIKR